MMQCKKEREKKQQQQTIVIQLLHQDNKTKSNRLQTLLLLVFIKQ